MSDNIYKQPAEPADRIIVPLDRPDRQAALSIIEQISSSVRHVKIGLQLFTAEGPGIIDDVRLAGKSVFLDLKFFDIPHTVAAAAESVTREGVGMINVHLYGGREMLERTVTAVHDTAVRRGVPRPALIGVTVLTSYSAESYRDSFDVDREIGTETARLSRMARDCGLDGVVCSGRELPLIREACGPEFLTVVPGIRPEWSVTDDQKRIMTPRQAVEQGADYLVIGRPITAAAAPNAAVRRIIAELTV